MPCYHLKHARRTPDGRIQFIASGAFGAELFRLPCGGCIGCRLEYARQWSVRMHGHSQMNPIKSFLTLTYDEQNLPKHSSLNVIDIQKFLKRFRKAIDPIKITYLQCGEYGDEYNRPHHHMALWGYEFPDLVQIENTKQGHSQWHSDELEKHWTHGRCTISELTYESSNYIARYILKKVTGKAAEQHYEQLDEITGELVQVKPEFITMSRNPAIGKSWIQKYMTDVYPSDELVIKGKIQQPPIYYDKIYAEEHPEGFERIKADRITKAALKQADSTNQRLLTRETVKNAQIKSLQRT